MLGGIGWLWPVPVLLALAYGFSNGLRDSATIVATVVSTGTLSPTVAFGLCALFEFLGALFIGRGIAATVTDAVAGPAGWPPRDSLLLILSCALAASLFWGALSSWRSWPTSNSQALAGGLAGAEWIVRGSSSPLDPSRAAVLLVLITSPVLGFMVSIAATTGLRWIGEWMTLRARPPAQAAHVLGCLAVSAAHGSNYGQIILALVAMAVASAAGAVPSAAVSMPLRLAVAASLTAGVLAGGRVLRRVRMKFYRIRDPQGLSAEVSAAATILACGIGGFPASTTQVVSGAIVGAGVAKNARTVRWLVVREIVMSWIIALPATAALAAVLARTLLIWRPL